MKNKPEWLDEALAGAPVVLRNGNKAFVRYFESGLSVSKPIVGVFINIEGSYSFHAWCLSGQYHLETQSSFDIVGLFNEAPPVFDHWHLLKEDYVAIAMDKDGDWCAYSRHVPYVSERHGGWLFDGADCYSISDLFVKDAFPNVSDWRQSLILRPEGENK